MSEEAIIQREDTMIYREPTADSDDKAVQDIWGKRYETKIVDAPEVDGYLAEGWVSDPRHIDNPPKAPVGSVPAKPDPRVAELEAENAKLKERIAALESDLKAAEELAGTKDKPTLGIKGK